MQNWQMFTIGDKEYKLARNVFTDAYVHDNKLDADSLTSRDIAGLLNVSSEPYAPGTDWVKVLACVPPEEGTGFILEVTEFLFPGAAVEAEPAAAAGVEAGE